MMSAVTAIRRLFRPGLGMLLVCLWGGSLAAMAKSSSPAPVTVTAVRHWSLGEVTRIAIETSGDFQFESDRLSNPERIFFDILQARQQISKNRVHVLPVNDGLVRQIRIAQNRALVTRIVLDLEGKPEVKVSRLANPSRLIIEVRKSGGAPQLSQRTKPEEKAPPVERKAPGAAVAGAPALPPPAESPVAAAEARPAGEAERGPSQDDASPVARPAKRNRAGGTSLTRALGLKMGKIVIDPGHGGRDTGTIGPNGLMEKDVALDVAKRLAKLVEERLGAQVVLTRSEDVTLPLEARTELANQEKADLFLSIHVNASRYQGVNGVETYYLNLTRSRADLEVAARENAGSSRSLHQLTELVQKIALDDKIEESRDFASHLQTALYQLARDQDPRSRNRGVKKAPFVVLIGTQMPSVLVELGFVSNPTEERLLREESHRQRIAEALCDGVANYAATLSHFQVARTGARQ